MQVKRVENFKQIVFQIPYYILLIFPVVHLGVHFRFQIAGSVLSLAPVNTLVSLLYVFVIYVWALWANPKPAIRGLAVLIGALSVICVGISLQNLGPSINDALYTGTAVLTVLYVFENAEKLLNLIKETDKYLTLAIWSFVAASAVLLLFFEKDYSHWGSGVFLFGHRYASVCGAMLILTALKLTNKPRFAFVYWIVMTFCFVITFWTGARIYVLSNLGTIYAIFYTFSRNGRIFLRRCALITIAALFLFSVSSVSDKTETTMEKADQLLADSEAYPNEAYTRTNALMNGRLWMWENCSDAYMKLPLINKVVGSGNKYIYEQNLNLNAHTDFLNILHFHGIIGLTVYLLTFTVYPILFWKKNRLPIIILIGFLGVWFTVALLNGYAGYTASAISLPYLSVMALWKNSMQNHL